MAKIGDKVTLKDGRVFVRGEPETITFTWFSEDNGTKVTDEFIEENKEE